MIHYTLSTDNPSAQYIQISMQFEPTHEVERIQLPAWRPGRYELGNFAKNVKGFKVYNEKQEELLFHKLTKDCWEVHINKATIVRVVYEYYAADLNAGSTFLSEEQLYVNPVNCFVFIDQHKEQAIEVQLRIPASWQIAAPLPLKENCVLLSINKY